MTTTRTRTNNDAAQWDTARLAVRDNATELRAMTTHAEIFRWANDHGIDSGSLFRKFKTELRKQLHVDYDQLRAAAMAARLAEMADAAATAPVVRRYVAGDSEVSAFAVCGEDGDDPWYGDFHEKDNVDDDQDTADLAAARKAVYLAGQARQHHELELVVLELVTCNHHVTVDALARDLVRHKVHAHIEVVDNAEDNPALEVCRMPGFRGWREVSLTDMLTTTTDTDRDE